MVILKVPCVVFFHLFGSFIYIYLLASSLTLSISAINDTSLSTMLKKEKRKEKTHKLIHAGTPLVSKDITVQRLQTLLVGSLEISKT